MGPLADSDGRSFRRGLAIFDPISRTARVAEFTEMWAHDALVSSPINHGLTMTWEEKGAQLGDRLGSRVAGGAGAGGGGVLIGGGLIGRAVGSLAQGAFKGDMPEVIIKKIRSMPQTDADNLVAAIMDKLPPVSNYPFSDISRSDDPELGSTLFFANKHQLTYSASDVTFIPSAVPLLLPGEARHAKLLTDRSNRKAKARMMNAAVVGVLGVILLVVGALFAATSDAPNDPGVVAAGRVISGAGALGVCVAVGLAMTAKRRTNASGQ